MPPAAIHSTALAGTGTTSPNPTYLSGSTFVTQPHNLHHRTEVQDRNAPAHIIISPTPSSEMSKTEPTETLPYRLKDSVPRIDSELLTFQVCHQPNPPHQTRGDPPQAGYGANPTQGSQQTKADQSFNITATIEFQVESENDYKNDYKVLNITFQDHPELKLGKEDLEQLKLLLAKRIKQGEEHYATKVRSPQIIAVVVFALVGTHWYITGWLIFLSTRPPTPFDEVELQKSRGPMLSQ